MPTSTMSRRNLLAPTARFTMPKQVIWGLIFLPGWRFLSLIAGGSIPAHRPITRKDRPIKQVHSSSASPTFRSVSGLATRFIIQRLRRIPLSDFAVKAPFDDGNLTLELETANH